MATKKGVQLKAAQKQIDKLKRDIDKSGVYLQDTAEHLTMLLTTHAGCVWDSLIVTAAHERLDGWARYLCV